MTCQSCGDKISLGKVSCGSCGAKVTSTQRGSSKGRKARLPIVIAALVLNVGIGAAVFSSMGGPSDEQGMFESVFGINEVSGTLRSSGPPLGKKTWKPPVCASGDHESFHGVYLGVASDTEDYVKVIKDPDKGYLVKVHGCDGKCETITLTKKVCDKFDVKVRETGTTINDTVAVEGHLRLDCRLKRKKKKGTSKRRRLKIKGNVDFEGCY